MFSYYFECFSLLFNQRKEPSGSYSFSTSKAATFIGWITVETVSYYNIDHLVSTFWVTSIFSSYQIRKSNIVLGLVRRSFILCGGHSSCGGHSYWQITLITLQCQGLVRRSFKLINYTYYSTESRFSAAVIHIDKSHLLLYRVKVQCGGHSYW